MSRKSSKDADTGGADTAPDDAGTIAPTEDNQPPTSDAPAEQPQTPPPADSDIAKPTPGRMVMFTNEEGDTYPATVSAVADQLHLTVFDAVMGPRLYAVDLGAYGDDRRQWRWPARS